ncbi:hypothetical protein DXG03_005955, partial [Asterophora parasitica]
MRPSRMLYFPPTNDSDSSDSSDRENIAPPPIVDADDAIVLSDLVRTGEASRLRRRGAMHAAHSHSYSQSQPQVIVVVPPSWEDSSDTEDTPPANANARRRPRPSSRRQNAHDTDLDYSYTLFCGAELPAGAGYHPDDHTPFTPSPLPLSLSPPVRPRRPPRRSTNGCGALLHLSAAPRHKLPPPSGSGSGSSQPPPTITTWLAHGRATPAVVLLPSSYLPPDAPIKIQRNACGCAREAIGCAECGNLLGTRYQACQGASAGRHKHPHAQRAGATQGVGRPDGRAYWRVGPRREGEEKKEEEGYTYTFLASAVSSSSPAPQHVPLTASSMSSTVSISTSMTPPVHVYRRVSTQPQPQARPQPQRRTSVYAPSPISPSTSTPPALLSPSTSSAPPSTLLDRLITASPTPLSDEERDLYRDPPPPSARPRYSYGYYSYSSASAYPLGPDGSVSAYPRVVDGSAYPHAQDVSAAAGLFVTSEEITRPMVYNADGEIVSAELRSRRDAEQDSGSASDSDLGAAAAAAAADKEPGQTFLPER